ncbi:unnamed protein product [Owenia fusiformis]|uniref:Choline/carnitine acyltransferase domain-containing protein n=1 Tax=Owenia fusiformis TaxID=6347 RepID=A0A8S4PHR9_OWEFU|nr:unnamed protein product [Owenia fusiformis]
MFYGTDKAKISSPYAVGIFFAAVLCVLPDEAKDWLSPYAEYFPGIGVAEFSLLSRISTGLVGFVLGYTLVKLLGWLRWRMLKMLLAYRAWMYRPKAKTTKVWAFMLTTFRGKGPFDTFHFDEIMPHIPLPTLDETLNRFLTSFKPLLSNDDFANTKKAVESFRKNEGPQLQEGLVRRYNARRNWMSDIWMNYAYLAQRGPIAVFSNFYGVCQPAIPTYDQLARAATVTYHFLKFEELIHTQKLPVVLAQGLVPICTDSYKQMFSTSRLPGASLDYLKTFQARKHIIVIRKGIYFSLTVRHEDDTLLTPIELRAQLQKIFDDTKEERDERNISALTGQNRTLWCKQRNLLLNNNKETLEAVESALFVLSLPEAEPKDYDHQADMCLTGRDHSIWFDKTFNLIAFANGRIGTNVEHAWGDGTLFSRLWEYALFREKYDKSGEVLPLPNERQRPLSSVKRLKWDTSGLESEVKAAEMTLKGLGDNVDIKLYKPDFGKRLIKKFRLSPDGFIQMAIQLAYYRIHKEFVRTYESASTRIFSRGRTETIRPTSEYSCSFVHSMDDKTKSKTDRISLLKKAIDCQISYKLDASNGYGWDRHMLGLYATYKDFGHLTNTPLPDIFKDKAWQMPDKLSTSQTPTKITDGWSLEACAIGGGFAPTCGEGYGVSYMIVGEDWIQFHVSSYKSCQDTDTATMGKSIIMALDDMAELMSK